MAERNIFVSGDSTSDDKFKDARRQLKRKDSSHHIELEIPASAKLLKTNLV